MTGRSRSSLAYAAIARPGLALLPTVRRAIHPGDAGVPALLASIDATPQALARGRVAARYADLLPAKAEPT